MFVKSGLFEFTSSLKSDIINLSKPQRADIMTEKIINGTPVHYFINRAESKTAILFLHPAFGNHTCFDVQTDYFKNYTVITMDLIGHGKSIGKGKLEDTAEYINLIMQKEKISKINLVGVSLGAVLVQAFANKYPEKTSSLMCIGGYDINNFPKELRDGNSKEQMKMMLRAFVSIKAFAEENKKISAYTKSAQEKFYKMNLEFKKSSFKYLASIGKMVNKQQTPERNYPLLIGVGEYDNDMAKKAAQMWHSSEPDSRYTEFKGAGHIVNMDAPEQFNKELEKILR